MPARVVELERSSRPARPKDRLDAPLLAVGGLLVAGDLQSGGSAQEDQAIGGMIELDFRGEVKPPHDSGGTSLHVEGRERFGGPSGPIRQRGYRRKPGVAVISRQ